MRRALILLALLLFCGVSARAEGSVDAVIAALAPIQQNYEKLSADKAYLESVMRSGAERASALAMRTLRKVHKKVGLAPAKL